MSAMVLGQVAAPQSWFPKISPTPTGWLTAVLVDTQVLPVSSDGAPLVDFIGGIGAFRGRSRPQECRQSIGRVRIRSREVPVGISKFGPESRFWTQIPTLSMALPHPEEAALHRCAVHSRPPHRPGGAGIDRGARISTANHPQWPRKALGDPGAVFSRQTARNSKTIFFSSSCT